MSEIDHVENVRIIFHIISLLHNFVQGNILKYHGNLLANINTT